MLRLVSTTIKIKTQTNRNIGLSCTAPCAMAAFTVPQNCLFSRQAKWIIAMMIFDAMLVKNTSDKRGGKLLVLYFTRLSNKQKELRTAQQKHAATLK